MKDELIKLELEFGFSNSVPRIKYDLFVLAGLLYIESKITQPPLTEFLSITLKAKRPSEDCQLASV